METMRHQPRRHFRPEGRQNSFDERLAVVAVDPNPFPERVFDVELDKRLRPNALLFEGGVQKVADEDRHRRVAFHFEVYAGVPLQQTMNGINKDLSTDIEVRLVGERWFKPMTAFIPAA